ncbi:DUF3048 domain-containing protein [Bacillus sp. Marseille-P3661]|uniref:DUF3048 domain-containing protein n=1 Tax=Bacillus sp. Marseille-P3661 TaxID=1936234 RepID=UPI000C83E60C|nr:DUF3048 domain-containing protein [Bacillus sp. Marseille-P3661]
MKRPTYKIATLLMIVSIIIFGCSNKETIAEPSEEPEIEYVDSDINEEPSEETKEAAAPVYENIFPLTGLGTNEPIDQRIFAIMINNHPKARPQSGLHKADIVYEILAEGYITRFLAVYQSELPEVVGPIRSARDYYIHLSKDLGAIYVAYGGSPEAFDLLQHRAVTDYIGGIVRKGYADDQFFYRANFRSAPHNVYIKEENLLKAAEVRNFALSQDVEPFSFSTGNDLTLVSGETAEEVVINYASSYTVNYKYDGELMAYVRYSNGEKTIDRETETPLRISNIFIVEAPHKVIDNAGRRDIKLTGNGKGYLIQRGLVQEVEWENRNGRIVPIKNGEIQSYVPGQTWVNVIPNKPGLVDTVSFGSSNDKE